MSEQHPPQNQFPTERWARWNFDINELAKQVNHLHGQRRIWMGYREARNRTDVSDTASVWHDWIISNYSDAMSIGIRRLVDRDAHNKPISLYELIIDISRHASDVTAANYVKLWQPRDEHERVRAVDTFQHLFPGTAAPETAVFAAEAAELRSQTSSILAHADQRIAHNDRKKSETLPTWGELDAALEVAALAFKRYFLLLTCGNYLLEELILPFGWEKAIERACKASSEKPTPT